MNPTLLANRFQHVRRSELLIDANLLVLYFVGARRPDLIGSLRSTRRYTRADYELLQEFLAQFRRMRTTPHVLTEVSNLMGQFHEPLRSEMRRWLSTVVAEWTETLTASKTITTDPVFPRVGLTDAAICDSSSRTSVVLTDDYELAGLLKQRGFDVFRFADLQKIFL